MISLIYIFRTEARSILKKFIDYELEQCVRAYLWPHEILEKYRLYDNGYVVSELQGQRVDLFMNLMNFWRIIY